MRNIEGYFIFFIYTSILHTSQQFSHQYRLCTRQHMDGANWTKKHVNMIKIRGIIEYQNFQNLAGGGLFRSGRSFTNILPFCT